MIAGRIGAPLRVALLSVHTSPLDQPGSGDAGGLNVYVVETALRLAQRGVAVEVFTRRTSSETPSEVLLAPGVRVNHLTAGPFEGLRKEDLPAQLCALTAGLLRVEASRPEGWFSLVHSHYWLSGQIGWVASERWSVPLVHTMHTMAAVKNAALALGDAPEPEVRLIGEQQVVAVAERLIANTADEAAALAGHYGADPDRIDIVHPGVDLSRFSPVSSRQRAALRGRLGWGAEDLVVAFIGRVQPLKGPDVLLRAAAVAVRAHPELAARLRVVICGGLSGSGLAQPDRLAQLAAELGLTGRVDFLRPRPQGDLADLMRAADLVAVPSYSESFGLVALEAQACGTPVIAARVGGLATAVADGISGVLVTGHDPADWGRQLADTIGRPEHLARLRAGTRAHAERFSWEATTDGLLASYRRAREARADEVAARRQAAARGA